MSQIIRPTKLEGYAGIPLPTAYRGVKEGWFPAPIKLGPRSSGFLKSEVDAFLARRVQERDLARKSAV